MYWMLQCACETFCSSEVERSLVSQTPMLEFGIGLTEKAKRACSLSDPHT